MSKIASDKSTKVEVMGRDIPNIFVSAKNNDMANLEIALKFTDVNSRDEVGMTPLHYAASTLALDAIERLLRHPEIKPQLADKFARSAASVAVENFGEFAEPALKILLPHCYEVK